MSDLARHERVGEGRRIVHALEGTEYERTVYVLDFDGGAVTYEAGRHGYASVNTHGETKLRGGMTTNEHPCEFLDGERPCWFDGTGLAPVQPDEEGIWRLLACYVPKR